MGPILWKINKRSLSSAVDRTRRNICRRMKQIIMNRTIKYCYFGYDITSFVFSNRDFFFPARTPKIKRLPDLMHMVVSIFFSLGPSVFFTCLHLFVRFFFFFWFLLGFSFPCHSTVVAFESATHKLWFYWSRKVRRNLSKSLCAGFSFYAILIVQVFPLPSGLISIKPVNFRPFSCK